MEACTHCARLLEVALQASKLYHSVLGAMEAAHITRDRDLALKIQLELDRALADRDESIKLLERHRSAHSKATAA